MEDTNADSFATTTGFGQQMCGVSDMEDPIGLSVAKMSYHVYSVGEGIIGRVAFTNKHQWVFSSNNKGAVTDGVPNRKANPRMQPEKYPSGWEHQFAAGIKTIAVISVPRGVVQLGSTCVISEDLKLIGHVKALFETLQNIPGAFLSDLVSGEAQTVYPLAVPAPQLAPRDPLLMNVPSPTLAGSPSLPANMSLAMAGAAAFNSNLGCSGVGRLSTMLASQQILTHAHSWPLPPVLGFQDSVPHFQHSLRDKPGFESSSRSSFPFFKPSCTWTGPVDKMGTSSQPGVANPVCITAPILSTGGVKANPPPRTGITRHLSLSAKASSIALPVSKVLSSQAGHSSFSANCCLTESKGVSLPIHELPEYSRAHGPSKPVSRTESPGPVGGNSVAAGLSDITSSIGSQKAVIRTPKENLLGVGGRSGLGNARSMGYGDLIKSGQLVGARPAAEQPCNRPSEQSLSVVLGRISTKSPQTDSGRNLAKHQQLGSSRSSIESQQLDSNPPSIEAGQLDWGSCVTMKGNGLVGNRLAGESRQLVSSSPITESSQLVVDRCSIQSGQYLDKREHLSLQSRLFGGANIANEKIQSASERSSVESSQPPDSTLSISHTSNFSGGISMNLERSTSSTIKQESGMSEFLRMSAETSPLQCEQSLQTFASDSSHLTDEISDLLQLAKQFENADRDDTKDLLCDEVNFHQSISSSLLCDDYFENLQSSKPLFQNLELNAGDSGSPDNSIGTLLTNELDDFDDFFAFLTKAEECKSEILPQPGLFASKTDNKVSASFSIQDITKGKEQFGKNTSGSNAVSRPFATTQAECERTLHTLDAYQPFSNCFAKEVALSCKELPSIQSEPQFDRFVNSRMHPKVSVPCFRCTDGGDTELGCQEMAALPPASRPLKPSQKGKKRPKPCESGSVRSKGRQQIQDRIRELRAIVPDGARCSIDSLLDKAVEYTNILQSMSQDSSKRTQSALLQSHDGGNDVGIGSQATSVNASWIMDSSAQRSFCPIVVENLSQPGQMLVEMLCEEHGVFLEVANTIKRLGLTILKGAMEPRGNQVWARFVTEGPQDVHRIRVLWSLMQLLGPKTPR